MADNTQLGYGGERYALNKDFWMMRGDTRHIVFAHDLGPSTAVKTAQLEIETNDSTATIMLSLTLANHSAQWDFTTDDEGIILLTADNTATIDFGSYRYAVQLTDQSDRVYTAQWGLLTLKSDVVDNDGTSPYPDWDTLDDLRTDISDMATCGNLSWLTAAATGGAMATLDVENGAIYTAADDIRLVLTNGNYEDDIVASMSDNEITLTATIAGEAAIGAVVRIL